MKKTINVFTVCDLYGKIKYFVMELTVTSLFNNLIFSGCSVYVIFRSLSQLQFCAHKNIAMLRTFGDSDSVYLQTSRFRTYAHIAISRTSGHCDHDLNVWKLDTS